MQAKVCDAIMGQGKTQAAITQMNEDVDNKYIFITPYLKEVERIKSSCSNRNFVTPMNLGNGKLDSLHSLLGKGENIVSTHALFKHYNEYTVELIKNGEYKLVLDEVVNVVEPYEISPMDVKGMLHNKYIVIEDNNVKWIDDNYYGFFSGVKSAAKTCNMFLQDDGLMIWLFPPEIFKAFKEIILLTYMFDAQVQKYYYDLMGFDLKYIGVEYTNGAYRFSDDLTIPKYAKELKDKIHIVDDDKLNLIGDYEFALSSSWYKREKEKSNKPLLKILKNNTLNVYIHKFKSPAKLNMWTTIKEAKPALSGKGYTTGFVSCNARATNEFSDRKYLAYLLNVYFNPFLKNYFTKKGITVKEDEYALSELVQWIWRSAIRNGEEIWLYIPSKRMRDLLTNWLNDLARE